MLTQALAQLHQLVPQLGSHSDFNGRNRGHGIADSPGGHFFSRLDRASHNQPFGALANHGAAGTDRGVHNALGNDNIFSRLNNAVLDKGAFNGFARFNAALVLAENATGDFD
ncbi:hypothetical protein D3C76_1474080 [compost metagenome]